MCMEQDRVMEGMCPDAAFHFRLRRDYLNSSHGDARVVSLLARLVGENGDGPD